MSAKIFAYSNAEDLSGILSGLERDSYTHIIIPSRKDKFFISEPDAWTWNDLYEAVSKESRRGMFSPPDHLLILGSILEGVIPKYKAKLDALPGIRRPGFLLVLSRDVRELLNEAVSPEKLTHNPDSDKPEEFLLPEVYSHYIEYLDAHRLIDSAQVCTATVEALRANQSWGKDYVMVFTGFLSFNHSQLELVRALEDRCREVIIIKPEAGLEGFGDAASQFGQRVKAAPSSGRVLELNITEPGLEAEMIARTLALWSAGEKPEMGEFPGFDAIGMMLKDGREDSFAQAFARYGIPYDFMSGIPISQTLPGKVLASVYGLHTRSFPTYDTAMLLTQPCFAGSGFPALEAFRDGRTGLNNWEEYLAGGTGEVFADALKAMQNIRKFCEVFSKKHTPSKIMAMFRDFLNTWLERKDRTADLPELDEAVRQTASAIETVRHKALTLDELSPDLGPVLDLRLSGEEAYSFLETWCRNTNTRAPIQTANSVRIFTGQPPVLASFPVWIMTGVTMREYSGNMQASPLLGTEERIKLTGMNVYLPTLNDKAQQKEAVFRRLVHTGENLTIISRPLLDDEGRPVSESPFMQRFRDEMTGWKVESLPAEGISILLGGDGFTFPEVDAGGTIQRTPPVITKEAKHVGASDIRELLLCPFLWWQRRQAGIYEPSSELASSAKWGDLLHKYWECVWKAYREDMNAPGSVFKDIADKEWQRLESVAEDYEDFRRLIHDLRLKRRLSSVYWRADRLKRLQMGILDGLHKAGWTHTEILIEKEAHLKEDSDGVAFFGQCDRVEILRAPDGTTSAFIADYKTGKGEKYDDKTAIASYWWNKDGRKEFARGLQLSVYAAMFKSCSLAGVYILGLEDGKVSGTIEKSAQAAFSEYASKTFDGDITARTLEGEYAMKCAVRVLERGEFSPEYSCDLCQWCKVKSLCRKGEFKGEVMADSD
ncbi:MAG: PD-(D/E)XK nuclease family protein [Synergistaceae bacterium]|nr:PD-(D/E)XK nuclease family protein [Synergistaceae bacterium]